MQASPMPHVTDSQRRSRLAVRQALAPAARVTTPEDAARAVVALHATDGPSVYLSAWARTTAVAPADIDLALQRDRTLVKQLAMRRTLFAFPRDLLPAVLPSAAARVAATERARMARDLVRGGITTDAEAWLDRAHADVLAALGTDGVLSAAQLRRAVPHIDVTVPGTAGESWSAPQVLTLLGAAGTIMRGPTAGSFPTARPLWTPAPAWIGGQGAPVSAADGYRELVGRWLYAFGPGTEEDLAWWLGSTKTVVRTALRDLDAVEVRLDGPATGWLLPADLDDVPESEPWTALLPPLDPTVMGWKQRDFYLGPHRRQLFDTRGNAGTTVWVNGRIAGCWIQDDHGAVRVHLLGPVPPAARQSLAEQADRLTAWLGGIRSPTGYYSPAMRKAAAGAGS